MAGKVITINRMYGSNGRNIGKLLAQELGIHYYDKELIRLASEKRGIPYEELLEVDEKKASSWSYPVGSPAQMEPQYHFYPMNDALYETESGIIKELAKKEDCIIIGRCANVILEGECRSVFIHAPLEYRVKTVMERLDRTEKSAKALVKKMDKQRRSYYEYFTDRKWLDIGAYDLSIDSSHFTNAQIVQMLKTMYDGM